MLPQGGIEKRIDPLRLQLGSAHAFGIEDRTGCPQGSTRLLGIFPYYSFMRPERLSKFLMAAALSAWVKGAFGARTVSDLPLKTPAPRALRT